MDSCPRTTSMPNELRPRFSQYEIAKAAGVSRAAVYDLEKKAIRKLRRAIEQEAKIAGVTVREWLFGD